ncbi:unnamed protein product [Periconia digitata]|uniref:Uncharacterized protein n=1 Tax=Periconia digitata TaxID=1303443 RepID=A0A9W4XZG5_9PLEO|nr:unnamed protein product [Periconia digitata]
MAPVIAQKASWLTWLVVGLSATAQAQFSSGTRTSSSAFWTVTSRVVKSTSTYGYTYTYMTSTETDLYRTTVLREVKSGVTPTATPMSTSSGYGSYYDDVDEVYAIYEAGAVAESDLEPDTTSYYTYTRSSSYKDITYIMPVTYTQPASCSSTSFSVTGDITAYIPSIVQDQITPTSKITTRSTAYYLSSTYDVETWFLSAGAAPSTSNYYYSSYVAECSAPPLSKWRSGTGSSGGGSSSSDDDSGLEWCSWYGYCTGIKIWIIIIASIIPGLFVLGFIESYIWFRRLMLGKGALRGGTVCWAMITLIVLCFTRSQSRRSAEDQKLLRENWNKTSTGQALKLWFKWGFKHRYPVPLLGQYSRNTVGIVPEGQPLPQMGQSNVAYPGFQPQPGTGPQQPPNIIYHNGQPYYSGVPPGWVPPPNAAEGQHIPAPGTAYIPPQHYSEAFAPQAADTKDRSAFSVSPVQNPAVAHPPPPQPGHVEAPTPESHSMMSGGAVSPVSSAPPPGPPPAKPT